MESKIVFTRSQPSPEYSISRLKNSGNSVLFNMTEDINYKIYSCKIKNRFNYLMKLVWMHLLDVTDVWVNFSLV